MKGKLILEDGAVFYGDMLDERPVLGEVVFNTGMTGYQEILTDPSYCSQIVTLTYPLIGNYGAAKKFNQSRKCFFNGFIVGELCDIGSNWQKEEELTDFLKAQDIPCLYNVDTRAVTRHIRSLGAMKGVLVPEDAIHFADVVAHETDAEGNEVDVTYENVRGVYVKSGSRIRFVQIFSDATINGYAICKVSLSTEEREQLVTGTTIQLYDEVIVEGTDLYDGKML